MKSITPHTQEVQQTSHGTDSCPHLDTALMNYPKIKITTVKAARKTGHFKLGTHVLGLDASITAGRLERRGQGLTFPVKTRMGVLHHTHTCTHTCVKDLCCRPGVAALA